MYRTILFLFAFITLSGVTAFAQPKSSPGQARPTPTPARPAAPQTSQAAPSNAPVPESRIALIDTQMFGDEKNGIYRYIDAVKGLEPEFRTRNTELVNLQTRINT